MVNQNFFERYLRSLLSGDRADCRHVIEEAMQTGMPANLVYIEMVWPMMVEIEKLFRADRISLSAEHMATRISRNIVDQLQNKLPRHTTKNKKIVVCCSENEIQELGGQMIADLFESDGWEVKFLGGGLTNEDILAFVNDYVPDILLIYGAQAKQAPDIRRLIDTIRDINAWPSMKIMVCGGLFNRAEGLWQEIGADLFAVDAKQALEVAETGNIEKLTADRVINRRKRRKKRASASLKAEIVNL